MQISLGLPDPREQSSLPVLKRVQAGISRTRMLRGATSRIRLPITITQLRDSLMSSPNPEKLVIWTIASTAFFGFFRLGELLLPSSAAYDPATCLSWGDVAIDSRDSPSMVQVRLRKSTSSAREPRLSLATRAPGYARSLQFSSTRKRGRASRKDHSSSYLPVPL